MVTAEQVSKKLKAHTETVAPGLPFHLNSTHQAGDGVWQGDLGIEVVSQIPNDYILVVKPTDADRQLVPESGQGSHHRLRSLEGVKLYRPAKWGESDTDLRGPCIVFDRPGAIVHDPGHDKPHGTVFIDDPMTVLCRYQRNLDAETKQERRSHD